MNWKFVVASLQVNCAFWRIFNCSTKQWISINISYFSWKCQSSSFACSFKVICQGTLFISHFEGCKVVEKLRQNCCYFSFLTAVARPTATQYSVFDNKTSSAPPSGEIWQYWAAFYKSSNYLTNKCTRHKCTSISTVG